MFYKKYIKNLPFESQIKTKTIEDLSEILSLEKKINKNLEKINQNKLMDSKNKTLSFLKHENLIFSEYGDVEPVKIFNIEDEVVKLLLKYLSTQKQTSIKFNDNHPYLYTTYFKKDASRKIEKLNNNITFFDIKNDNFMQYFHIYLRKLLSNFITSPFSIVNTRAWITKPCSERFGPNSPHKDGFHKGHIKTMIYLTPLINEYGEFWIEDESITSKKRGTCILFKNSDYLHSGIPGTKFPRISIEITVMRSFVNCNQFYNGHVNGRHYLNLSTPYDYILKKANII